MTNENKDFPSKIQYSIWDTRTEENLDNLKEKFAEAMDTSSITAKTTKDQK